MSDTPAADPGATDIDRPLVLRAQGGDSRAFDLLVVKYQRRVERLILRMVRNPEMTVDLAQETFIRAWRAIPKFRAESTFYTWLHRIAVNTAKRALMNQKRDPVAQALLARHVSDEDDGGDETFIQPGALTTTDTPEAVLASREIAETVNTALNEISPDLSQALTLRELEGLSYEEIAQVMDCPIGTVRSRIFRAREAVAQRLRPLLGRTGDKRW